MMYASDNPHQAAKEPPQLAAESVRVGHEDASVIAVRGDLTGSRVISLTQIVRLARAVTGADPLTGAFEAAGDLNQNGRIDLTDLVILAGLFTGVPEAEPVPGQPEEPPSAPGPLDIQVGERTFTAVLADADAARVFADMLPYTAAMSELNGNEKYVYLERILPSDPASSETIQAGDLMLYGNNCVVLFYETFPTPFTYTRIGHI